MSVSKTFIEYLGTFKTYAEQVNAGQITYNDFAAFQDLEHRLTNEYQAGQISWKECEILTELYYMLEQEVRGGANGQLH